MDPTLIMIPRWGGGILHATFYSVSPPNKDVLIILCHGFTGDQTEWGRFVKAAEELNHSGYNALTFDFSGSGKNKREPITLTQQIQDLQDVYNYAQSEGFQELSTVGLSFGGITSLLAELPGRKSAIFWAPAFFVNRKIRRIEAMALKVASIIKAPPIKRKSENNEPVLIDYSFVRTIRQWNVVEKLGQFSIPSLIVQGVEDADVPAAWADEALKLMKGSNDHKLLKIPGAGHNFSGEHLDQFILHTILWLKRFHRTSGK